MIKVNGKVVEQNRFPDGSLNIKGDFEINKGSYLDSDEIFQNKNYIVWLYDSDTEIFTIMSIVDILRRNGGEYISLIMPYLTNSRMDRIKSPNENFSLKVFANWLNSLNLNEVCVLNVHSNVSEALINNIKSELPEFDIRQACEMYKPDVIFFPDEGACKRYSDMTIIKELNIPIAFGIKKRDWNTGNILGLDIINGDAVKDKRVLIIDDIISKGYTFFYSGKKLKELGATSVSLYATHCENTILEGELLSDNSPLDEIYTTDTICTLKHHPKIKFVRSWRSDNSQELI